MNDKENKAAISWKIAADRQAIGEPVELASLPGFWVKPRKFTRQAEAELLASQSRAFSKNRQATLAIMADLRSKMDVPDGAPDPKDIQDEAYVRVLESATAETVGHLEEDELRIAFGVEEHNFNGMPEKASRSWAKEVLSYGDISREILQIVGEKNRPLPKKT